FKNSQAVGNTIRLRGDFDDCRRRARNAFKDRIKVGGRLVKIVPGADHLVPLNPEPGPGQTLNHIQFNVGVSDPVPRPELTPESQAVVEWQIELTPLFARAVSQDQRL